MLAAAQEQHPQQQLHQFSLPSSSGSGSGSGSRRQQDPRQLLPPLNVVGGASSDWCLLDVGPLAVHVLTERARRFYALEGLWGGVRGQHIRWLRPVQPRLETKDTIGRPAVGA